MEKVMELSQALSELTEIGLMLKDIAEVSGVPRARVSQIARGFGATETEAQALWETIEYVNALK